MKIETKFSLGQRVFIAVPHGMTGFTALEVQLVGFQMWISGKINYFYNREFQGDRKRIMCEEHEIFESKEAMVKHIELMIMGEQKNEHNI